MALIQILFVEIPCITAIQEMGIQYGLGIWNNLATNKETPIVAPKMIDSVMFKYLLVGKMTAFSSLSDFFNTIKL